MKLSTDDQEPSANDRLIARLLVAAQFGLIIALAVLPRRTDWQVPAGVRRAGNLAVAGGVGIVAVASASLGRGMTAVPLPNDNAQLRTGGVYRLARHPIYTGVLIAATARALLLGNRWAGVVTAALGVLLNGKARFEEQHLAARFPGYADYADRTPRFIPLATVAAPPRVRSSGCQWVFGVPGRAARNRSSASSARA